MKPKRVKTIYNEKYVTRAVPVMRSEALKIASEASQMFAVEQGEIEIPTLQGQRRLLVVIRFEQIIREPASTNAVDPPAQPQERQVRATDPDALNASTGPRQG